MLSIIIWVFLGLFGLAVIYTIAKILFVIFAVKKVVSWARDESKALPEDYRQMRREVANENSIDKPTADLAKKVFVRWFDKFR